MLSYFLRVRPIVVALLACIFVISCIKKRSGSDGELKIKKGRTVSKDDVVYPVVGSLARDKSVFCSASLLSGDYLLTAAHCIGEKFDSTEFNMGGLADDQVTVPVSQAVIHPCYLMLKDSGKNKKEDYDLAVVKLDRTVSRGVFGKRFVSIGSTVQDGDGVVAAGYGRDDKDESGVFRKVNLTVTATGYSERQIVATNPSGGSTCNGDSGGPLFLGDSLNQVGVTAWGPGGLEHGDCESASVSVKLTRHKEWIDSIMSGKPLTFDECPSQINPEALPVGPEDDLRGPAECRLRLGDVLTKSHFIKSIEKDGSLPSYVVSSPESVTTIGYCHVASLNEKCLVIKGRANATEGKGRKCFVYESHPDDKKFIFFETRSASGAIVDTGHIITVGYSNEIGP
jgi:V8-like Glu-specific endopeptidase